MRRQKFLIAGFSVLGVFFAGFLMLIRDDPKGPVGSPLPVISQKMVSLPEPPPERRMTVEHTLPEIGREKVDWKKLTRVPGGRGFFDGLDPWVPMERKLVVTPILRSNSLIQLFGWAIDDQLGRSGDTVFLVLTADGEHALSTVTMPRKDVGDSLKNDAYSLSGWIATFTPASFKPGKYRVAIRIVPAGGSTFMEIDTGRWVEFIDEKLYMDF